MAEQRITFAAWLTLQGDREPQDMVGWLARAWDSFAGPDRPRLSSPHSIGKYLSEHGSQEHEWQDGLSQALETATQAYREAMEQPSPPADDDPAASHAAGVVTEADLAGDATMAEVMAQVPPAESMDGAEHALYLVSVQLGQLQRQVGILMQMMAAASPAAAQVLFSQLDAEAEAAMDSTSTAPQVLTESQQQAASIARQNGWLNTLPGGFAEWWAVAEPGSGDGDG